jgi:hypothetical protein
MSDLAQRLGIASTLIRLESIVSDEFSGGDLGCPQPDQSPLAQPAIISGQRILLDTQGTRYEYRTAGRSVVYCGMR